MKHKISRTTEWRRRKNGIPLDKTPDGRGRLTNEERAERLAFVGAVAAQLHESGCATVRGLKVCAVRVPTAREVELKNQISLYATAEALTDCQKRELKRLFDELNEQSLAATVSGDIATAWKRPPASMWREIEQCPHNPDLIALVVAYAMARPEFESLAYHERHKASRGKWYSDFTTRRNRHVIHENEYEKWRGDARELEGKPAKRKAPWKVIDGMTRQTASYWMRSPRQKESRHDAMMWFFQFMQAHNLGTPVPSGELAILRDDIADFLDDLISMRMRR